MSHKITLINKLPKLNSFIYHFYRLLRPHNTHNINKTFSIRSVHISNYIKYTYMYKYLFIRTIETNQIGGQTFQLYIYLYI